MWSDLSADRFIRRVCVLSSQICTILGSKLRYKCEVDFQVSYIDQSTLRINPLQTKCRVLYLKTPVRTAQ